jgi:triacylglycerol lipase
MMLQTSRRRMFIAALAAASALVSACTSLAPAGGYPPIVFVHGNGDSAALWSTTLWRFESNGWPSERLHAIDLPYPLARDADDQPQAGRSSSLEHRQFLASEVDKVLKATGARQVVLFANSRGGNAVRSYIAYGGGADKVSHAILGGTPNHGVWSNPGFRPTNEFNGAGPFLTGLNNQGAPGVELTPGPKWMTIRSDNNDKFAQPDGLWIGARGTPTNVSFSGPELKGASNVVLAGIDHRETSFSASAFDAAYRFIAGRDAPSLKIAAQSSVVLDGKVSGLGLNNNPSTGTFVNNLPLAGASVEVYATHVETGERLGAPLLQKTVAADGRWGPLVTDAKTPLEFVVRAPGYAVAHIYRAAFPRSSNIVHLRAELIAAADKDAGAIVSLSRPRGYLGVPRDRFSLDGLSPAPGIVPGVAGLSSSKLKLGAGPQRTVVGEFNGERIVGRTWPAAEGHVVTLEVHQ